MVDPEAGAARPSCARDCGNTGDPRLPKLKAEAKAPGRAETRSRISASGCSKSKADETKPMQDEPVKDIGTSTREDVLDSKAGPNFAMPRAGEDRSAQARLCGKGKDPKCAPAPPKASNARPSLLKPKAAAKMPRH